MYALQHGSLFVTSFVFQMGLLFKVNAVSPSSPTFAALSAVLMVLCGLFLVCWLTVVLVYIPQNILAQHPKSAGVRRWLGWLPRLLPRLLLVPTSPTGSGATLDDVTATKSDATVGHDDGGSGGLEGARVVPAASRSQHSARFEAVNPLCGVAPANGAIGPRGFTAWQHAGATAPSTTGVNSGSSSMDAKSDTAVVVNRSAESESSSLRDGASVGDRGVRVPRMLSVRRGTGSGGSAESD